MSKTIVNSWNEWDPLKHVILGKADGTCIPAPEPALDAKVPENSDMRGNYGPRKKDTVDRANELLDNFESILIKRDIKKVEVVVTIRNKKGLIFKQFKLITANISINFFITFNFLLN